MKNRRGKSREIAHHSAAQRQDKRRAIQSRLDHAGTNRFRLDHRLGSFAGANCNQRGQEAGVRQTSPHIFPEERRDVVIRNDRACGSF